MSRNKKQKGPKKFPEDRKRDPRTQGRTQRQKGVTKERGLMNSELTKERSGEMEPSAKRAKSAQIREEREKESRVPESEPVF